MTPLVPASDLEKTWAALDASSGPVVLFGDSTTAPRGKVKIYGELLEETFREKNLAVPIINAGVGGNTTRMARRRLERDVLAHHPSVVVIQFGINDSAVDVWKEPPVTEPRVPREEYRENLEFFIDEIRAHGGTVILMTPNRLRWKKTTRELYAKPPYHPEEEDGFNIFLDTYAQAVREIAQTKKTLLVDIHAAYAEKSGDEVDALLSDGMHPNNQGHALVHHLLISE